MKKIVFSNYDDISNPYYGGGGAISIHNLCKGLSDGYDVYVVSGKFPGSKDETIEGVRYKRIGLGFGGPKIGQLVFQFLLPFYVRTWEFDVWVESFTPPFSTALLQLFTKKPVIGLVHMLSGKDMRRKYKIPFQVIENIGLKTYKYFIVTSKLMETTISRHNPTAVKAIIPNAYSGEVRNSRIRKKYIVFIGRIEVNQKGLDLLLQAYLKFTKQTNYKLVIAGTGEEKQIKILTRLIEKYNLANKVLLVGRVKGKEKTKLLQQALCVVVPSRFETFSMASLEALIWGIPLVTFDIEGLKWIPNASRFTTQAFNTSKLSTSIQKATKNSALRNRTILNGKKLTKDYTNFNITQKYSQFFKNTLNI